MTRQIPAHKAILEATDQLLDTDPSVYLMGLGVPDPKGIFGTTLNLHEKYGSGRVMDMPTSENAMTGIAIGSAISGMRPIMTHQRIDFFLLALDQLINNGSKWHYMFANQMNVPLTLRLIIGRGWGQGPQHSQSLHNIFAHIPGLKVVMPSNAYDAKGLLISAVQDDHPVVYIEHRWLHGISGEVPDEMYQVPIGKAKVVKEGSDVTVVALSHMVLEAYRAAKLIEDDVSVEIIDVRSLRPLDDETILQSVKKTKRLIVADPDWKAVGYSAEILALVFERLHKDLEAPPVRITYPDRLCPTSWALSNHFYPTAKDIALEIMQMMGKATKGSDLLKEIMQTRMQGPMDVPDSSFTGPF